jgi:hypothetical protein
MRRRVKVAADKQVVYNGKHYFGGQSLTADNDDAEVDRWIEHGYIEPAAKGGKGVVLAITKNAQYRSRKVHRPDQSIATS